MIPSINFVLAGPIAMVASILFGGMIAGAVLSGGLELPNIADVAQICLAVVFVYVYNWVEHEWVSFDEKVHEDQGNYFPAGEKTEENIFEIMALAATAPFAMTATDDDDNDTAVSDDTSSSPVEPEPAEVSMIKSSSRSSFSESNSNLWQVVLASGKPFQQVSRRSFVLESS